MIIRCLFAEILQCVDRSVADLHFIENDEVRFLETLDTGLKLLNDTLSEIQAKGEKQVPGDVIFKLYDTFGFPVDIVRDVVRDENMNLDMEGFDNAMDAQRARSSVRWMLGRMWSVSKLVGTT